MRSLVLTRWLPWPPTSGSRHRSANMIAALAELGDVDVFVFADAASEGAHELTTGTEWGVDRIGCSSRAPLRVRRIDRLVTAIPGMRPAGIRRLEVDGDRAALGAWMRDSFDLAWIVRIESWMTARDLVHAPTVVDFDDLRDELARSRHRSAWPDPPSTARPQRLPLGRWASSVDATAWRRLQRKVASQVDAVTVCSDVDRERLRVPNSVVVPNGVDVPTRPVGRVEVGEVPTICFHGSLSYRPNTDAAEILVRDVLPRVRARVPAVAVRLVGRSDAAIERLADPPRVVVTGLVPDIVSELARVDLVAVPLREGAGTRIKILEALAHRIPVVATSIAVEGLDVEHGRHLLVADDPDAFAEACASLLIDRDLRCTLADAGAALVSERYQWSHARAAVRALATSVVARRP